MKTRVTLKYFANDCRSRSSRKLVFDHYLNEKILKANIIIGLINRLRKPLPRDSVLTIYKDFVRPHLSL